MKRLSAVALLCLPLAFSAYAQSAGWRDDKGQPIAETESLKSKDGFAASVIVTSDQDWEAKWKTPPETKPNFTAAGTIGYGKKVHILTFFVNPGLDGKGNANVRCDFKITGPDGKVAMDNKNMVCHEGKVIGGPYNLRLSQPVIGFSGDDTDAPGEWVIDIVMHDSVRKVSLPLRTRFTLKR